MEQEKFLSEEKYQETNKKVNNTSNILTIYFKKNHIKYVTL